MARKSDDKKELYNGILKKGMKVRGHDGDTYFTGVVMSIDKDNDYCEVKRDDGEKGGGSDGYWIVARMRNGYWEYGITLDSWKTRITLVLKKKK